MTAQHPVLNLFFYVTPGSAQANYVAANGDLVSSATGNPTLITQAGDATGGTNKIAVPTTCRVKIAFAISAATTFAIRVNGVDTLANGGVATVIAARYLFEDIWTPAMFTGTGISFRFGANCTVYSFQAVWQAV